MVEQINRWMERKLPQNFMLRHPLAGSAIEWVFCFIFTWLYEPLNIDRGYFSYEFTIVLYSTVLAGCLAGTIYLLRRAEWFADAERWNIKKELASVLLVMYVAGTAIYFAGFIVEVSPDRWYFRTYFDSVLKTFLVGGIPFFFFTSLNIYALFGPAASASPNKDSGSSPAGERIELDTPLKSEELHFYPDEFIYAFSEGNYVTFYLNRNSKLHKKVIRCTISSVEEQLKAFPFLFRSHRAYIVNLNKVENVSGNSLGYRLQLSMADEEIPVARSRTSAFKNVYRQQARTFHHKT